MMIFPEMEFPWSSTSPMERNLSSERETELGFDGNRTDILVHWYYPNDTWEYFDEELCNGLMAQTVGGHLRWALFVPKDRM